MGDDTSRPAGVARLGEALAAHDDDVLVKLGRRITEGCAPLGEVIEGYFNEMAQTSLRAFSEWLQGALTEVARNAGFDAYRILGQLAATQEVPLNEVIKRQLCWRDSVEDVLCEHAVGIDRSELADAVAMLHCSSDVTLVRMGASFEIERQRLHEELVRREDELTFLATSDPLTGLPNRTLMLDRLDQMLARAGRNQTSATVVFIDLDNFKAINDSLGHAAGDELLCAFADRLKAGVRESDTLGRIGGDEFVIVAEDELSLSSGPELLAERLLDVLKLPFVLSDRPEMPLTVTVSLGLAAAHDGNAEDLLRDADIAMYRAKRDGKNGYTLFEPGMGLAAQSHLELEMDLHTAVTQEQFELVYQPIFDLRDMRPTGMEALLRWNHPTRGTVAPLDFIPTLEKSGLICQVGKWVLEQACRQGATWTDAGTPVGMSVNVSGKQLDTDDLIDHVRDALAQSGLDPEALTLEITETTLMRDTDATVRRLAAIKELGVRIAIDDFGTGYSSLAHLQQFPIDSLKIDRSFISQMAANPEGEAMIKTLVQLGKALAIETLAEGIEQHTELEQLLEQDCDSGQGFLFARPLEAGDAASFLQTQVTAASRAT